MLQRQFVKFPEFRNLWKLRAERTTLKGPFLFPNQLRPSELWGWGMLLGCDMNTLCPTSDLEGLSEVSVSTEGRGCPLLQRHKASPPPLWTAAAAQMLVDAVQELSRSWDLGLLISHLCSWQCWHEAPGMPAAELTEAGADLWGISSLSLYI